MTDIKSLIERLRCASGGHPAGIKDWRCDKCEAADALENLGEAVARGAERENKLILEMQKLQAELAEAKKEADGYKIAHQDVTSRLLERDQQLLQMSDKFEAARGGWADSISEGIDDDAALKCVDGWIAERLAGEKAP